MASGTRTGDGSLTFTEKNNSGIQGSVTVTFTAQDIDSANIISIERNTVVESEEVTAIAAGADLTIDLAWDAVIDKPTSIYVYRGTSTGSYDGYFLLGGTAVTFSDDGTRIFDYDTSIDKTRQIVVERQFLPEGYVAGVWHPCSNRLAWRYAGDHCVSFINCNAVINKYTWVGSLETYNIAAFNEFTSWL